MKKQISLEFDEFSSKDELDQQGRALVESAEEACSLAYAPYSKFYVGAVAQLEDGTVVVGSNKENASFPAGTCAERNVLNYISDHYPGVKISRLAIVATADGFEMSGTLAPCGICRQVICEVEKLQSTPIEILMSSTSGKVVRVSQATDLLPFHFYVPQLKK